MIHPIPLPVINLVFSLHMFSSGWGLTHNTMLRFLVAVVLMLVTCAQGEPCENEYYTVDSVRECLVRQEDTIVFGVIERVRFPINSPTYHQNYAPIPNFSGSLLDFLVHHTEAIQAQVRSLLELVKFLLCY